MQEQLFVGPTPATTASIESSRPSRVSKPVEREWELDEATKAIGLRGVATARQALRNALAEADENLPAAA